MPESKAFTYRKIAVSFAYTFLSATALILGAAVSIIAAPLHVAVRLLEFLAGVALESSEGWCDSAHEVAQGCKQ